jgi:hypothetical protein
MLSALESDSNVGHVQQHFEKEGGCEEECFGEKPTFDLGLDARELVVQEESPESRKGGRLYIYIFCIFFPCVKVNNYYQSNPFFLTPSVSQFSYNVPYRNVL